MDLSSSIQSILKCSNGLEGQACDTAFDCAVEPVGYCINGQCTANPPVETNLCDRANCGNQGTCIVVSEYTVACKCENTFEQSTDNKGRPTCACPDDWTFDEKKNRCIEPPTIAPSTTPTVMVSWILFVL